MVRYMSGGTPLNQYYIKLIKNVMLPILNMYQFHFYIFVYQILRHLYHCFFLTFLNIFLDFSIYPSLPLNQVLNLHLFRDLNHLKSKL